jgi:O-antigen/teichoic acid export membrane protein
LLFIGTLSSTIILAVTSIIAARLLGPEDYGLYSITLTVPSILVTVSSLGISQALTRYAASLKTSKNKLQVVKLLESGLILKVVFTLFIASLMFLLSDPISKYILNRPEAGKFLRITILYLIGQSVLSSVDALLIGLNKAGKSSLLNNIQAITRAITTYGLIITGYGLIGALIGIGLGFLISTLIGLLLVTISFREIKKKEKSVKNLKSLGDNIHTILVFGTPLYISQLLFSAGTQFRSILLAMYCSNESIGNYSTALNYTIFITLIISPITTVMFPAFSKLSIFEDKKSLESFYRLSVKYTSFIVIPAATGLALLSEEIVTLLYGTQYQTAPRYLSLYSLFYFLITIGMNITGLLLNSQGDTGVTLRVTLINLVASLGLGIILVPRIEVPGLIASIILSQLISNLYSLHSVKNKYQIKPDHNSSVRIILSSLISGGLVYLFLNSSIDFTHFINMIMSVIIFIPSYIILIFLTGAIKREDLENIEIISQDIGLIYPFVKIIMKIMKKLLKYKS